MGKKSLGKGKILGKYKILEPLDPYPRLQAYKARDLEQQRVVCLLTLADAAARRPDSLQQIQQHVNKLCNLEYAGLAKVYEDFESDDQYFVTMEFIPGANLETILQRMQHNQARPRYDEGLGIFHHVLASLARLEQQRIASRSIDPCWIYFRPEPCLEMPFCTVLTDPGIGFLPIARPRKGAKTPASTMSGDPERQIEKLGVLLYRLVIGKPAPDVSTDHVRLVQESPGVPERVVRMLERLLAQDRSQRFGQLDEIAEALAAVDSQITQISSSSGVLGRPESLMGYYLDSLVNERSGNTVAPAVSNETDKIQINGPGIGRQVVPLSRDGITIGRVAGNDIVLNDLLVSRLHARIDFEDGSYRVIDLNSTNGTFLGDQKLLPGVPETWRPGTPLRLGDTVLRLLLGKEG